MASTEHEDAEHSSRNAKELGDTSLFTMVVLAIVLSAGALIFVIARSIAHDMYGISFAEAFAAVFVGVFGIAIAALLVVSLCAAALVAYLRKRTRKAEIGVGHTG